MIYLLLQECLWVFSVISFLFIYSFRSLKKTMSAVVATRDPPQPPPPPPSSPFSYPASTAITEMVFTNESKRLRTEPSGDRGQEVMLLDPVAARRGSGCNLKVKKRPARLVLPPELRLLAVAEFSTMGCRNAGRKKEELEVRGGKGYYLASKKGRRDIMEDGFGVALDISGDPKQAFFAVIDGHSGRAAADYVAENLGKNIVREVQSTSGLYGLEEAIRCGYSVTDKEFLSKGVVGGACAASVLLKGGEMLVANVGDCRVVLSRNGVADTLTSDHRPSRDDERLRIESSGGFVHLRSGVWRVQGSLAISRAIGDIHLKEWIISEPEVRKIPITSDCEFLILASDGLWDKVMGQEAVDVVSQEKSLQDSCRKLVEMSSCRGNMDDITVMVVNLRSFSQEL